MNAEHAPERRLDIKQVRYVDRVLRQLGVPRQEVADVRQRVLLFAYRSLSRFDGRAKLETWLYRICIREAAHHKRRARMLHSTESALTFEEEPRLGPGDRLDERQRIQLARRALEQLTESKRTILVLHYIDEVPMREVARRLCCPLPTAYSRLQAARDELEKLLRAEGDDHQNPSC